VLLVAKGTSPALRALPRGEGLVEGGRHYKSLPSGEGPRSGGEVPSLHRKIPRRIAVTFHAQTSRGHEVFQHFGDALFAGGGVAAFETGGESLGLNRATASRPLDTPQPAPGGGLRLALHAIACRRMGTDSVWL
jgi:hypothetical protein